VGSAFEALQSVPEQWQTWRCKFVQREGTIFYLKILLMFGIDSIYPFVQCRSPEEYAEKELTEKIDIFSLGSIMFSLLTGLIPFDEITDEEEMMDKFMAGKLPFIDPRYKNRDSIERKFVEVMEDCWKFKPEDRPTAVEVARRLEELVMEESI